MLGIIRTFDASLHVKRKRNFLQRRFRAIKLTLVLTLLIIATILLTIGQGHLFALLLHKIGLNRAERHYWIGILRWVLVVVLFLFSIAYIYKYAPSVYKRWRLISPGAIFATFLIVLTTYLFSIWAQHFSSYNRIYGSIGALLIVMLLIFINSLMLLVGYELNVSISYLKSKHDDKEFGEIISGNEPINQKK